MANHLVRVEQEFEEDESLHFVNVSFQVENALFTVPRRHFEESAMFRDLFQLPAAEGGIPDGLQVSQDIHFRLEGIAREDFKQLLRYMDPRRLEHPISFSLSEYTSILKLSTMWELVSTRAEVIIGMSSVPIGITDKIALARDYDVVAWLFPSLIEYARRGESIKLEDVDRLGLEMVIKIVQLRESMVRLDNRSSISERRRHNFTNALQTAFEEEIRRVRDLDSQVNQRRVGQTTEFQEDDSFRLVDLFFLVENCLFKGRRQYFEISPIFRDMFQLPVAENCLPDGCSKGQPLRLEDIKKADFKQLLRFMDARSVRETKFTLCQWTSVLKLSTMWEFANIRQFAVGQLSVLGIDVVEKIALARDYHISHWLLPHLNKYTQGRSVTVHDVDRLGLDYILKIIQVREKAQLAGRIEIDDRLSHDFTPALHSAFRDEIEKTRTTWSMKKSSTAPVVVVTVPVQ